jgi:hypothetical protein
MSNQPPELVQFFWNHFPRKYLEQVFRSVFDCYEAAYDHCETHFERAEAGNVLPFVRRAMIEAQLREIARSFPEIAATARRSPESAWNHTLVICGRVALTESTVSQPEENVRPSIFRQQYSARDNVRHLFPEMEPDEPAPDSMLYGILLHGRSEQGSNILGFARIRFPKENVDGYQPGSIDLFQEFPQVVLARARRAASDQVAVEQIPEPVVELRTDQLKAGGEA